MEVKYLNELLWPGQLGQFCIYLSFVGALFALLSYFFSERSKDEFDSKSWLSLGRLGFLLSSAGFLFIFFILFYLILSHKFEYQYVWQHSSTELPLRYVISCFWEGQEGSFLLWAIWHVVLGTVIIKTAGKFEAGVMFVVCLVQFFLGSMLLGLHIGDVKIGSTPFMMLRDFMDAPIFRRADYMTFITDGNGLNPLLQNYWMVIHPPTLFLGFSACLMPFAYSIAGLWKNDFSKEWSLKTLNWTLFSGGILGTGVLMGAAWAYEALTFGGFWAWDPVENSSLVPWLILLAGLHTLVIFKSTGYALKSTIIFLMLTFVLILYSTFLTRSGILGDTSVHAFTDLGMSGQLLIYMLFLTIPPFILLAYRWTSLPDKEKEESAYSREFWMFVGSLIFLLVGMIITYDTSLPVINKLFGSEMTIVDAVNHYNRYTIWFGIIILLGTGLIQFFKYKTNNVGKIFLRQWRPLLIAAIITAFVCYTMDVSWVPYIIFTFSAIYAVTANADYMMAVLKGNITVSGGSVSHIGFALILLGVLLSAGKKEVISINEMNVDLGKGFDAQNNRQNILLYKDMPLQMDQFKVTYKGDSVAEPNIYYKVQYDKIDMATGKIEDSFTLLPNAQQNPKMGLIASPDTRHYLSRDVYTHVTKTPNKEVTPEDLQEELRNVTLAQGDSLRTDKYVIRLNKYNTSPANPEYIKVEGDIAIGAMLEIFDGINTYYPEPVYYIRGSEPNFIDARVDNLGLTIKFQSVNPASSTIDLVITEQEVLKDWIVMKAIVFPFINVLWAGCFMMLFGFILALLRRWRESKRILGRGNK